jgi:hypothetical protein
MINRYLNIQRTIFKIAFKVKKLTLIENKKETTLHLWKVAKMNPTGNEYVLKNKIIQSFYQKLLNKQLELIKLKSMYNDYYKLNEVQQEITEIKNNIRLLAQQIIKNLYQEVKEYENLQNQIEHQINDLISRLTIYFPSLKDKHNINSTWMIRDIFKISPLFITDTVEEPPKEYMGSIILKKIKITLKSISVSFCLALLIIGILELVDPRIKDVYQIERKLKYPIVVTIPSIKYSEDDFYEMLLNKQDKIHQISTLFSQFAGLLLSLEVTLLPITSPKCGSGRKTFLLGCIDHFTFGERLLIINADIVNCEVDKFKKLFKSKKEYNLYNMLKKYVFDKDKLKLDIQNMFTDPVREVNGGGVYFINVDKPAGCYTRTFFSTEIFYEFILWIQHFFDRVLLILPPLNTSIGIALASNFDDLVIVFRGNHTTIQDLKAVYLFLQTIKTSADTNNLADKNVFLVANDF